MTDTTIENDSPNSAGALTDDTSPMTGRLDVQHRLAKWFHEKGFIYVLYGSLDGLSLNYSTLKYFFDVMSQKDKSSSDVMHDWMLTPAGIVGTALSSIGVIVFSLLANHFKDDDKNALKRFIAISWPYIRDMGKAVKNSFKGIRSTFQLAELFGSGKNLRQLIVPFGVLLGVFSIANRLWYRHMIEQRKKMMTANKEFLEEILKEEKLDRETLETLKQKRTQIPRQSKDSRTGALFSACYGGAVDGLYLYMGIFSVCAIMPPALIVLTVFCSIYMVVSVVTRIYEEYNYQHMLTIAETRVDLALESRELELRFAELEADLGNKEKSTKFQDTLRSFIKKREKLQILLTPSYASAFLAGIRNGLYAYSAFSSVIFAVATILTLAAVAFPPALLIAMVSIGMAALIGFTIYSLVHTYRERAALKPEELSENLTKILASENCLTPATTSPKTSKIRALLLSAMDIDIVPQFFQAWSETLRSFFSGLGKGSKAVDFTMNPLQELDDKGHYHDSLPMLIMTGISALVHSLILAFRAFTKGFKPDESVFTKLRAQAEEKTKPENNELAEKVKREPEGGSPPEESALGEQQNSDSVEPIPTPTSNFSSQSSPPTSFRLSTSTLSFFATSPNSTSSNLTALTDSSNEITPPATHSRDSIGLTSSSEITPLDQVPFSQPGVACM